MTSYLAENLSKLHIQTGEYLTHLELAAPPGEIGCEHPNALGLVLEKIRVVSVDRNSEEYLYARNEQRRLRPLLWQAWANHPEMRTLLWLAVGEENLAVMEEGRAPTTGNYVYQLHHPTPISRQAVREDGSPLFPPNDVRNVTMTKTNHGHQMAGDFHNFWHTLLHVQDDYSEKPIDFYTVRSIFPIYPPVHNRELDSLIKLDMALGEWKQRPKELNVDDFLDKWGSRIVLFSQLMPRTDGYYVPIKGRDLSRAYFNFRSQLRQLGQLDPLAEDANEDFDEKAQRKQMTEIQQDLTRQQAVEFAPWAKQFLPAGAWVNGEQLAANHKPEVRIPVVNRSYQLLFERIERKRPGLAHSMHRESRPALAKASGMENIPF